MQFVISTSPSLCFSLLCCLNPPVMSLYSLLPLYNPLYSRPLTDYSPQVDPSTLSYCGEYSPPDTAVQLGNYMYSRNLDLYFCISALGNIDLFLGISALGNLDL